MKSIIKIILISLLLVFIAFTNNSAQNHNFQNQLRLAKSFEQRGNLDEAKQVYQNLLKQQPQNFQFYQSIFKILVSQKKYNESLELTKNQIIIDENNVNLYGDLGSVYFLMGDEEKANETWDNALSLEPENAFAYRIIADYLIEHRIVDRAVEILKMGNEVADDKTIFSYEIANLYSLTMKYAEATHEYCEVLKQKPKQINLVKNRIASYLNANQATKATIETVEKFYNEDENIIYLELLADLYAKSENRDKALETTIQIEDQTTKNGSVIFAFAQQSTRVGDHKNASKAYKIIIDGYPNSGLYSEAEIGYTRALESDLNSRSDNNESWKPLVISETNYKAEYNDLVQAYKNLAVKHSDNKVGWESEFRIAAILLHKLKQYEKSDSIFKKIIREVNDVQLIDQAYYGLAQIALKQDDLNEAENYLLKIEKSRIAKADLKSKTNFLLAKIKMWKGEFSKSIEFLNKVTQNSKDENVNDALQYSLLLNTFKNDSTNLFLFTSADYLLEKERFSEAIVEFKKLADNESLFLLKDFAALNYIELKLALNNYQEAVIFLEEVSKSDEDHIYKDRFLYLLGSNYYYGLKDAKKALVPLSRIFDEFPNSIFFNKARKIVSEINEEAKDNI